MAKLTISPEQTNYSASEGAGVVALPLAGGPNRYRRDILNANVRLPVTWIVNSTDYQTLRDFFYTNEGIPFTIDLILDSGELATLTAVLVPQTLKLDSYSGQTYTVSAQLEVTPADADIDEDRFLVLQRDYPPSLYDELEQLVNVEFF